MKEIYKKIRDKGIIKSVEYISCIFFYKVMKLIIVNISNLFKVRDNYIMFLSRPDYSDNAKVYFNFLKQKNNNKDIRYIWLVEDRKKYKNNNQEDVKFVKRVYRTINKPTIKALFYTSISSQIYFTHMSPLDKLKHKKNQTVINLWHGCGYKNVEKREKSYIETNYFDYALVPGDIFIETKSKFWGCKKEKIWNIGYPRYDLFFRDDKYSEEFIKKIGNERKILIWMPTFRKTNGGYYPEDNMNQEFDLPILNSTNDLLELNELCKKNNIQLCVKRHPMQVKYQCEDSKMSNIVFISNEDLENANVNLYSLLRYTNGLITDYSSIAIDYLLLDKPIAFTLNDFENYKESRGFVFDNPRDYMPGNHIYEFNDFKEYIIDVVSNQDKYKDDRYKIVNKVHNRCANYCERLFEKIEHILEENING